MTAPNAHPTPILDEAMLSEENLARVRVRLVNVVNAVPPPIF